MQVTTSKTCRHGWRKLRLEVDNLRAAQSWALEHDLHAVMQLASAATTRWGVSAQLRETYRFLQMVLARQKRILLMGRKVHRRTAYCWLRLTSV